MELEGVEGVEGKLKVWIRRVWTLEMVWNILSLFVLSKDNHWLTRFHLPLQSVIGLR